MDWSTIDPIILSIASLVTAIGSFYKIRQAERRATEAEQRTARKDDLEALRVIIQTQNEEIADLDAKMRSLQDENLRLHQLIQRLRQQIHGAILLTERIPAITAELCILSEEQSVTPEIQAQIEMLKAIAKAIPGILALASNSTHNAPYPPSPVEAKGEV